MHYKLLLASLVGASTVLTKPIDLPKRERCDQEGGGSDCIVGMEVSTVTDIYTILVPKDGSGANGGVNQGDGSNPTAYAAPTNSLNAAPTAAVTKSVAGSSSAKSSLKGSGALSPKLSTTVFQSTLTPTETTVIVDAVETDVVFLTTVVDVFESGASTGKSPVSTIKSTITSTAVTTVPSSSVLTVQASTVFITVTDVITDVAGPASTSAKASSSSVASSKATGSSAVVSSQVASSSSATSSKAASSFTTSSKAASSFTTSSKAASSFTTSSKAASSTAASTKAAVSSSTQGDKIAKPTSSQAQESSKTPTTTAQEKTITETSVTGTTVITEEVTIFTTIELGSSSTSVAKVVSTSVTSVPLVTVVKTLTTDTTVLPGTKPTSSASVVTVVDGSITATATVTSVSAVSIDSSDLSKAATATTITTQSGLPASALSTAPQAAATSDVSDANYFQPIVNAHNVHRSVHHAPNVTWDTELADIASSIAKSCVFAHNMGINGVNYGQNIEAETNTASLNPGVDSVEAWYGEQQYFADNHLYGQATPGANFESYGHFTQLVWVGSTHIGCGTVDCDGLGNFTVCNYLDRGNVGGQYNTNVLPPN